MSFVQLHLTKGVYVDHGNLGLQIDPPPLCKNWKGGFQLSEFLGFQVHFFKIFQMFLLKFCLWVLVLHLQTVKIIYLPQRWALP